MLINLGLFYLIVFLFSMNDVFKLKTSSKKIIYIYLTFAIAIYSFFIYKYIPSTDFKNYTYRYSILSSINDFINGSNRGIYRIEIGFGFVNVLIKTFINNEIQGISLLVGFSVLGIIFRLYRYTKYWFLSLLVYIGHFYGWNGLILLRQTIAIIILFPLLNWIPEKKYFHSILLILFASLFHVSSLIYILVFPLYKILQNKKILITAIVISFLIGFFNVIPRFVIILSGYIPRGAVLAKYILDMGKGSNRLSYIEMLLVLGVALYFKTKLCNQNKYSKIAITYLGFAVIFAGLLQNFEIGARFVMAFNFFSYIILLPEFICILKKNWKERLVYTSVLGVYLMAFFIRFFYVLDKY